VGTLVEIPLGDLPSEASSFFLSGSSAAALDPLSLLTEASTTNLPAFPKTDAPSLLATPENPLVTSKAFVPAEHEGESVCLVLLLD